MMDIPTAENFVDFYAILEIDLCADPTEIEKQFFELGQKLHPDVPITGDQEKFELLTLAFQTLRIPESRQAYDDIYLEQNSDEFDHQGADSAADCSDATLQNMDLKKESTDRILLMQKFYERRRVNFKNPGLAAGSLDGVLKCSRAMIDFHLWYCQQRGWLFREESGQLSITADGVDHVENGLREND